MSYNQTLHIFYILILGIFIIGVESFTPKGRVAHSSILTGTKLYFFGGTTSPGLNSNEVFYLDVSQTFGIASPPWTDLTMSAKIPFASAWAGMSLIDINDDPTVHLFGGIMSDPVLGNDTFISIIHSFNIKTSEWKIPYINGKIPARRRTIHAVSDNKGKVYIFGGSADSLVGSPTFQSFNDMVILDTISSTWSYGSLNAPTKRNGYSATILTNGVIVYIGGFESGIENKTVDINQINLYDTNLDAWSVMTAKSTNIIEPRTVHSAALAPDGNIMIFGGGRNDPGKLSNVKPDIAILNTQIIPFEWVVPTVSSNVGKIPSLYGPTTNFVGNYMIVSFGLILPYDMVNANINSNIYIMDTRNYTWVSTFDEISSKNPNSNLSSTLTPTQIQPTQTTTPITTLIPTQTPPNGENNKTVIGVLSGVIGVGFLGAIGFLGYKLHKKYKREHILNIPGSI